jgi:hypothetical protein
VTGYFIKWKGAVQGPFQESVLKEMILSNKISRMHLISEDSQQWALLSKSPIYLAVASACSPKPAVAPPQQKLRLAQAARPDEPRDIPSALPCPPCSPVPIPERFRLQPLADSARHQATARCAGFWRRLFRKK